MRYLKLTVGVGLVMAFGVGAAAQSGIITFVPPPKSGLTFSEPWRPNGSTAATRVIGSVVDIRQLAVASAKIRLRNLDDGTIEGETESNENGEYEFATVTPGTFIVEMLMPDGSIVGLSNAGSLARNETLQTVVQLPGRWDVASRNLIGTQSFVSFVGMSAATSITGATLTLAGNQNIGPVDAGEAVSPGR